MKSGGETRFNGVHLTDQSAIRLLWIFAAIAAPIFGVSFGHVNLGSLHLAPSVVFVLLIAYFVSLRFFLGRSIVPRDVSLRNYKGLAALIGAFIAVHLFSLMHSALMQSDWLQIWGIKNMVKLFTGVILFWITLIYFPRDETQIGRFFLIGGAALAVLLAVFIHRYAIVSHMPFLATDYYGFGKTGKNQMAVQTVFFFSFLFPFFLMSSRRWLILPFLLILMVAILYLESRMGWAATALGLLYTIYYIWRRDKKAGRRLAVRASVLMLAMSALTLLVISHFVDLTSMALRFFSIFNPDLIPKDFALGGKYSYHVRGETIAMALQGFVDHPLLGAGLGSTFDYVERPTHNDFITILTETGIVGEILFLVLLGFIWKRGRPPFRTAFREIPWLSVAARAGFVSLLVCMNLFNMYLSPYFWIYLALYIVTVETTDVPMSVPLKT